MDYLKYGTLSNSKYKKKMITINNKTYSLLLPLVAFAFLLLLYGECPFILLDKCNCFLEGKSSIIVFPEIVFLKIY